MARRKINDPKRNNHSTRAMKGHLEVIKDKYYCSECGHRKFFVKPSGIFCCRCSSPYER